MPNPTGAGCPILIPEGMPASASRRTKAPLRLTQPAATMARFSCWESTAVPLSTNTAGAPHLLRTTMGNLDSTLLEQGIYSLPQASRLVGVPLPKVRRWMKGGVVRRRGETDLVLAPLWCPRLPAMDGQVALSFLDLMELRLVHLLIDQHDMRLPKVRECIYGWRRFADRYPYPLINRKVDLFTAGTSLKARLHGEDGVFDLTTMQYVMGEILRLRELDLDYDDDRDLPTCWWPRGRSGLIVVDPHVEFGDPVTREGHVPTRAIAVAVGAEGSEARVARMYRIEEDAVRAAVEFEKGLRAGNAAA